MPPNITIKWYQMRIKLFTLPNILTLSNLLCGSFAILKITLDKDYLWAFLLIVASACFDFLDGLSARLTGQHSAIGVELDSLADMVSFGLAPSILMFSLCGCSTFLIHHPLWINFGGYISFIIVAFSALRLAKFNIDESQHSSFEGLPTPANALFCMSLGLLYSLDQIKLPSEAIVAISVVMALFLISPLRMFSFKFSNFGWSDNKIRYIFVLTSAIMGVALKLYAIPLIVIAYILFSVGINLSSKLKNKNSKV